MNCLTCRGACCEEVILPVVPPNPDAARWLALHALPMVLGEYQFEVRCRELTSEGRCGIYEDRPDVCRYYQPGGRDCLDTVRRRRTAEDYQRIREAGDPPCLAHERIEVSRIGDAERHFVCAWCGTPMGTEPWPEEQEEERAGSARSRPSLGPDPPRAGERPLPGPDGSTT